MKSSKIPFLLIILLAFVSISGIKGQLNFAPSKIAYPAKITWGTFMYSEQLFDRPERWAYVRKYMDSYLMHQQYWLNTNYLVYCLGPTAGKNRYAEFAAIIGNKPVTLENAVYFQAWGVPTAIDADVANQWVNNIITSQVNPMRKAGINLTDISIDMGPKAGLGGTALRHPDWKEADLIALYGNGTAGGYTGTKPVGNGFWKSFVEKLKLQMPEVKANIVASPVYFNWIEPGKTPYPSSMANHLRFDSIVDYSKKTVKINGQNVTFNFDGYQWFTSHFVGVSPTISTSFVSDVPYSYWNWGNITVRDAFRNIIKGYETWLHANNREHHLIVTGGAAVDPLVGQPDAAYCSASQIDRDKLDKGYYESSMSGIKLYQKLGIRADNYVVESWLKYPYDVADESNPYSFASVGKDIIKYLKGPNLKLDLKKVNGTGFQGAGVYDTLAIPSQQVFADVLPIQGASKTYEFVVDNANSFEVLPMLKMQALKMTGATVTIFYNNMDITNDIMSVNGFTFTDVLSTTTSSKIKVVITNNSKSLTDETGFCLWLYWNPQDPYGHRDAMAVTYNKITDNKSVFQTSGFSIFPNPATSFITIKAGSVPTDLYIYNSLGQHIQTFADVKSEITIPTTKIGGKGIYFIRMKSTLQKLLIL